eukprot:tig00000670_g3041.t1
MGQQEFSSWRKFRALLCFAEVVKVSSGSTATDLRSSSALADCGSLAESRPATFLASQLERHSTRTKARPEACSPAHPARPLSSSKA